MYIIIRKFGNYARQPIYDHLATYVRRSSSFSNFEGMYCSLYNKFLMQWMYYIILFACYYNYYNPSHALYVRIPSSYLILCHMLKSLIFVETNYIIRM